MRKPYRVQFNKKCKERGLIAGAAVGRRNATIITVTLN